MSENTEIEWTDNEKSLARQLVNVEVRFGARPHPNTLPCVDCGHLWASGERRHEYDHHLGYAAKHRLAVEPVCTLCHAARDSARKHQTHCSRGHEFDVTNTKIRANGTRCCRACSRIRSRARVRPEGWWTREQRRGRARGRV